MLLVLGLIPTGRSEWFTFDCSAVSKTLDTLWASTLDTLGAPVAGTCAHNACKGTPNVLEGGLCDLGGSSRNQIIVEMLFSLIPLILKIILGSHQSAECAGPNSLAQSAILPSEGFLS